MITILTGLPRSGKSYRAVWQIYETFINPKSKDYKKHRYMYTNIGGFKFDVVNDTLQKDPIITDDDMFTKEALYLDWNVFYSHLEKLHEMAKADKSDEELLRYCRYHKLTPAIFFIDEAYRFYTKLSNPVLVWWHGYHGHLGHDILIIIHRPTLMNSDFKAHCEEFIDAQPKSKALLSNQFRYFFYASDSYTKSNRYHTDKLTASSDIFALYKSGDLHTPKKIVYKFIGISILAALFTFGVFSYFMNSLSERANPDVSNEAKVSQVNPYDDNGAVIASKSSVSSLMLLRVRCDSLSCSRVDPAFVHNPIPSLYFEEILKSIDSKLLASTNIFVFDDVFTDRIYSIPSDSINYLSMWNIPVQYINKPAFSSTGDVYKSTGVTQ